MSPLDTTFYEPDDEDRLELVGQLSISDNHNGVQRDEVKKPAKVHFNQQVEIRYVSNEDMTLSLIHKADIWYMKSDLIAMRKNDRESLLVALKNLTSSALGSSTTDDTPHSPTATADSSEPFCFRGMEVILYKRERDECRRRAAEAVMNVQQRNRNMGKSVLLDQPPASQRIADAYRLLTRTVADEAYLRGLGDAREAREVFQQSLLFPSVQANTSRPQARNPMSTPKPQEASELQEQDRESVSNDIYPSPTSVRDIVSSSPVAARDAVSWKTILQRNSQLRSSVSTDPTSFPKPFEYHADSSTVGPQQVWKCCTYGGK